MQEINSAYRHRPTEKSSGIGQAGRQFFFMFLLNDSSLFSYC